MTNEQNSKGWNIGLWIAQILMAGAFGMAGFMKLTTPIADLSQMLPWVANAPEMLVRFIGLSELLGALGLVLPTALRIQPKLTNTAALGLGLVMILALIFHLSRGEYEAAPINLVLLGIMAFINWGRNKKAPILPKG